MEDSNGLKKWLLGVTASLFVAVIIGASGLILQQRQDQAVLRTEFQALRETNERLIREMKDLSTAMQTRTGTVDARLLRLENNMVELDRRVASGFGSIEEQIRKR